MFSRVFPLVPGCSRTMNVSGRRVQVGFPKPFFGVLRSVCGPNPKRIPAGTGGLGVARPSAQAGARLVSIRRRGGGCGAREASTKERSQDAPCGTRWVKSGSRHAVSSGDAKLTHGVGASSIYKQEMRRGARPPLKEHRPARAAARVESERKVGRAATRTPPTHRSKCSIRDPCPLWRPRGSACARHRPLCRTGVRRCGCG